MTMAWLENLWSPGMVERLGWMLVHVVWQATVVALLLAVFLRLLRKTSANARYSVACAALALTVALPIATLHWMKVPGPAAEAGPQSAAVATPTEMAAPEDQAGMVEYWNNGMAEGRPADSPVFHRSTIPSFPPVPAVPLQQRIVTALEPALPYVVLGWLAGVLGLSAWHLGGWTQLQRLRRRMVRAVGDPLQQRLEELSSRLGVHRAVGLLESALVEVPTVVGWLRPVILLPASALTGLSLQQLEAIIAHELAHIRRYDYLVNMLQTVVEILGFYHPAIWWISRRIRIERENCCDDLAVHVCGSSLQYARALACMEELRHHSGDLALAATGGSLMARIARLLGRPAPEDRRFAWLPGLIALLLVVGVIIPAALVLAAPSAASSDTQMAPADSNNISADPNEVQPSDTAAQVLLDFKVLKVRENLRPDRETVLQMVNTLGNRLLLNEGNRDMTVGEILRRYVAPEPLSEEAASVVIDLLQSRGFLEVSAQPRVLTRDGRPAEARVIDNARFLRSSDRSSKLEKIEYGTTIKATCHVIAPQRVVLTMQAEVSALAPGADPNQPVVSRRSAGTSVPAWNDRYLVWAAMGATPTESEPSGQSVYILVKPQIKLSPTAQAGVDSRSAGMPGRRVLLEVRTVTTERAALLNLGVQWSWPTTAAGVWPPRAGQAVPATPGSSPNGVQIGYTPDQQFTESLLAALDLLQRNRQADVSSQQILAQEGHRSRITALLEKWVPGAGATSGTGFHKIESGTILTVTPRIGDHNDITAQIELETSEGLLTPGVDLPVVSRRVSKSMITIRDGGTVAVAGLRENGTGAADNPGRETAVFITAHVLRDSDSVASPIQAPAQDPSTRRIRLNYTDPNHVRQLLSPTLASYVQSEPRNPADANAPGRTLLVQATGPLADQIVAEIKRIDHPKKQVVLDARVVALEKGNLLNLGVEWNWTAVQNGAANMTGTTAADSPYGVQFGYTPDWTFTNSLLRALNLLEENNQADTIAKPQVVAQDGGWAEMKVIQKQWYMATGPAQDLPSTPSESQKVETGTVLRFLPHIADNNEITLQMALELSDSMPQSRGSDSPVVTRRVAKNSITIRDGGTVAVAGLTTNPSPGKVKPVPVLSSIPFVGEIFKDRDNGKTGRDVVVFVTARLVSNNHVMSQPLPAPVQAPTPVPPTVTAAFARTELKDALTEISRQTGVKIVTDATVKSKPITAQLAAVAPEAALQQVLKGTDYAFRKTGDGVYLVFEPLSFRYDGVDGVDLCRVLQDLSVAANVPIATAPNVSGTVTITFENMPLEEALALVLAGKPYVFNKMPRYYLVAGRPALSLPPAAPASPVACTFSKITAAFAQTDLREVLAEISKRTGAKITPDATVKPAPVTTQLADLSVDAALRQVLQNTGYTFRQANDGTYLVYRPLSNAFLGIDLNRALRNLSDAAGVPIVVAPEVSGTIRVFFNDFSLEEALELVLAGKPYAFEKGNDGTYLVSRAVTARYAGRGLREALNELATAAGVPIVVDPNVSGTVNTAIENLPLDQALRLLLAGTAYTFRRTPDGYLVGPRPLREAIETRRVRLNRPSASDANGLESPAHAKNGKQGNTAIRLGARFGLVDEQFLRDLRGQGPMGGVTAPSETRMLHEIGRRLFEDKSLALTAEQAGLLMKAAQGYRNCSVLSAPKVVVRENEPVPFPFGIGDKTPYTLGYDEPNKPGAQPKPRQATVDSGLNFEPVAQVVDGDRVRLTGTVRVTTLLGFEQKKYQNRYTYQVPQTEEAVVSLDGRLVPSGGTCLTLGPKTRLKPSDELRTMLVFVTLEIVEGTTTPANTDRREAMETRRIRLKYAQPLSVKRLLSRVFTPYVQTELPNPRDPNDSGNQLLITAPRWMIDQIVADVKKIDLYKRQVQVDARVVALEPSDFQNLGVDWDYPTRLRPPSGTSKVAIACVPSRTARDMLMTNLDLLSKKGRANTLANPKAVAQDGQRINLRVVQGQWFLGPTPSDDPFYLREQVEKFEPGIALTITPRVTDNNYFVVRMGVEVLDSIPKARGSDLPLITRHMMTHGVTIKDGDTVAVAGLTADGIELKDKSGRAVTFFATVHLVPESSPLPPEGPPSAEPTTPPPAEPLMTQPAGAA